MDPNWSIQEIINPAEYYWFNTSQYNLPFITCLLGTSLKYVVEHNESKREVEMQNIYINYSEINTNQSI